MKPWMKDSEICLFRKYLSKAINYYEFGSGGSTYIASEYENIQRITSVESLYDWITKISEEEPIKKRIDDETLKIIYIDVNAKKLGKPRNKEKIDNWPLYSQSILTIDYTPDLILVDGRFRVASALQSYKKLADDGFLIIHDYTNRPQYHIIEKFYDKVINKRTLQVFKKKPEIVLEELEKIIKDYELIFE